MTATAEFETQKTYARAFVAHLYTDRGRRRFAAEASAYFRRRFGEEVSAEWILSEPEPEEQAG